MFHQMKQSQEARESPITMTVTMTEKWKRLEDEPAVWFARFDAYRLIGPRRSIDEAYRRVRGLHQLSGKRPGQAWYNAAEKWDWQVRAEAWDAVERDRLLAAEATRRFDAREERLGVIDRMMRMVQGVMVTADPESLTMAEAREMLPMMRLMLRDMLAAQRLELGLPQGEGEGSAEGVLPFTADELAKARRELAAGGVHGLSPSMVGAATAEGGRPHQSVMMGMPPMMLADSYSATLTDALARLYPDEQSARRVASQAGVDVSRVKFGSALNTWHEIVEQAQYMGQVDDLMSLVGGEYGMSAEMKRVTTPKGAL